MTGDIDDGHAAAWPDVEPPQGQGLDVHDHVALTDEPDTAAAGATVVAVVVGATVVAVVVGATVVAVVVGATVVAVVVGATVVAVVVGATVVAVVVETVAVNTNAPPLCTLTTSSAAKPATVKAPPADTDPSNRCEAACGAPANTLAPPDCTVIVKPLAVAAGR